jgi:predicted membrane metal-binding protein
MAENKFDNRGDFRGAALFQGSTIENAGQIAGTIQNADQGSRAELQTLLQKLGDHLKNVPREKVEDAEAMSASAEDLVKEAAKDKPNKSRLRSLGTSLVDMAKVVGTAAPAAISLAEQIVGLVGRITGGAGVPPSINV